VLYLWLIILSVGGDIPVDSEALLVTDFMNLKINSTQSFRDAHRGRMYMRMFVELSAHTYMSIYVCTVFLKKTSKRLKSNSQTTSFCHGKWKKCHSCYAYITWVNYSLFRRADKWCADEQCKYTHYSLLLICCV
jgi:hypothetical protein